MAISLSYDKLFTIGVDSLMIKRLKWSHATDITNMGQFNHHFLQCMYLNVHALYQKQKIMINACIKVEIQINQLLTQCSSSTKN